MASWSGGILQRRGSEPLKPGGRRKSSGGQGKERQDCGGAGGDLTRDDLLFLLSMMEGELQARDEVITVLKAGTTDLAPLESHYGFKGPAEGIRALHRDSVQAQWDPLQDVYAKPMVELDRLVAVQRRSFRQMLEQLLEVERSHSGALCRLEEQDRKHRIFIQKSDDLTAMLEQDRERLKLLIIKEKEYQERKEEESEREILLLKEELTKLKAFALLVVNEQQCLTKQLEEQRRRVQELTAIGDHAKQELTAALSRAKEEELRALHLEEELHHQASILLQNQVAMTAKLANEDTQRQELRQRLAALSQQLDELEGTRTVLRRAEEELQELRDRERGLEDGGGNREGTSILLSEVEVLRRRVAEMEGRDEELMRMRDESRDLDRRIGREASQCRSLKVEVEKLNGRISELDKLEEALGKSRQECGALKGNLEKEKGASKQLSSELDTLKVRIRELEAVECQLEKKEVTLRQDLAKLRTLTMALVEDRKSMAERLQKAEEQPSRTESKENNQNSLTIMTLRDERRQALRSKADLEERIKNIAKDKDELLTRLKAEEERNKVLQSEVSIMKSKLQVLESRKEKEEKKVEEMHIHSPSSHNFKNNYQVDDNKVKELSQEVERLHRRLKEKEVVEGELVKAEEDFESLERRFRLEQERSQALMNELEEAKTELSRYHLAEKQEVNSEHLLLHRLQQEQVKSRLLGREVEALKDKVQRLMGTEESISKVQMDHSALQRKLTQQEARNRELAREMEGLTTELERYRRFSRTLRPGVNGRRFTDLHQSTKEVQTEPGESLSPVDSNMAPFLHNGKLEQESDEEDPNQNEEQNIDRRSSTPHNPNNFNHANNNARRHSSSSVNSMDMHQLVNGEVMNGNLVKKGDVVLTHTPGQPLHIKVTPDHSLNTATLEISSPPADTTTSFTSTAVIPTSGAPPKQRITIIQNSALSTVMSTSPERALSPPMPTTPISQVASLDTSRSVTPDQNSPVQIVTVSTCSPEPPALIGQAVLRMSPERENSWHLQRSNSANASPSVITTEDNKIHIHLGSPYVQGLNGLAHSIPQLSGQYYTLRQEHRTQMLTNGCHVKGAGKITSSITITPATSPVSHPSKIAIPQASLKKPGPTRIPKPKGYGIQRGTNRAPNAGQNRGKPLTVHTGKNTGLRTHNIPKTTTTC
ncbi:filamin A-interacting protein 1-like [Lampris incognitus]|uniref:filamin A-interacting protein 1-like n=1 Tax=Lampris incognitus TaxID=2546036 RepID=UPI0024B634A6|nr:filamin A-interacting protein 1-like [Lampris incognitus]